MPAPRTSLLKRVGEMCRTCATMVIAGVWRTRSFGEVEARVLALPPAHQVALTIIVLGFLFALSLFAAQFGWLGIIVFWLAVIALAR